MKNQIDRFVAVSQLPAVLRSLVKSTGCRPTKVEVRFSEGPACVFSNYSTRKVVSIGKALATNNAGWVGSDSEYNPCTATTYSAPVAEVSNYSRKNYVTVYVGSVPANMLPAIDSSTPSNLAKVMAVVTDAALES